MATVVNLPKLGQTMEAGLIVEWLKAEGDPVSRGDVLFTLESDKAVLEVEARAKGVLRRILLDKGIKVPVGTPVAIIGQPDEDISALLAESGQPEAAEAETAAETAVEALAEPGAQGAEPFAPEEAPAGRVFASPRARRLAGERGVAIGALRGSGPEGRIVEKDVLAHLAAQPAATPLARREAERLGIPLAGVSAAGPRVRQADVAAAAAPAAMAPTAAEVPGPLAAERPAAGELRPLSGVRAIIAERMGHSAHTTAPVTLHAMVDATELVAVRERLKAALADRLGFSVGYNDLLAVMTARCLVEFPYMNVRLEEGGIRQLEGVNLGLAVDSQRGLLVPVIRDADRMGVAELATRFRELVAKAREGRSLPDELTGGNFTITNLGMFGVDMFTPIINLPECAILGVGRIRPEPVAVGNEVQVRQVMWLSLTFDHRLVDGAPAARFLQGLVRYIESPYLLLA
jgi:pyruvate dehydrogenase E2 component (dihydrolipoamide acetyltransferase)